MKLYATVKSERASKGQGGNEYLKIEVTDENNEVFLKIDITPESESPDGYEQFRISLNESIKKSASHWAIKQKSKDPFKGWNDNLNLNGQKLKGKSQKGEKRPQFLNTETGEIEYDEDQ